MLNFDCSTRFLGEKVVVVIDRAKGYYHPKEN